MMAATLLGFTSFASSADMSTLVPSSSTGEWDTLATLQTGYGYKDNVFLAHAQQENSGFALGSGEFMALVSPSPETQISVMASGETRQFVNLNPVYGEYEAFALGAVEHHFSEKLTGTLTASYLYLDQVQDVSVSETNRQALPTRGHTITLQPGTRYLFSPGFWLGFEPFAIRQFYAALLDDYWQAGPGVSLGHSYGKKSELSFTYEPTWQVYDTEPALNAQGEPIPGSTREDLQQDFRLRWKHSWTEDSRWRTSIVLSGRLYRDIVGDYFDYTRAQALGRVQYRMGPWQASGNIRIAQYWYETQTVSQVDLTHRKRTEIGAGAQVERELWGRLRLVAAYQYERTLSNDPTETYSVNTVSASLQLEF